MGQYETAYDHLNDAYVSFCELYGDDSVQSLSARFSLAQYDYLKGDPEGSLKMLQYISDSSVSRSDDKALATAALSFSAKVYEDLGDHDKALETYDVLFKLYDNVLKEGKLTEEYVKLTSDPGISRNKKDEQAAVLGSVLNAICGQGAAYTAAGEYEKACDVLKNGIEIAEDNIYIGRKNLITSRLYMNLAKANGARGYIRDAVDQIDLAMRIQKNLFDYKDDYPGLVEVYDIYGDLLMKKTGENGYVYYQSALDLALESYGENHPKTAEALYCLGKYYASVGVFSEAFSCLERALEIRKNILGYEHESTARYLYQLAKTGFDAGDKDNALVNITEAMDIMKKTGINGKLREDALDLYDDLKVK